MNVCVLYYDGFCEFEVVLAVNQFRENAFSVAIEIGKVMNIYKDEEEIKSDYRWLKNIK